MGQKEWRRGWDSITAISRKSRRFLHLAIIASVYAGCKHIRNFGYSCLQLPQFTAFPPKTVSPVSAAFNAPHAQVCTSMYIYVH